jgi:hypothetical protein
MSISRPPFVSEREGAHTWPDGRKDDAADEDCVFAAGLMQALAVMGRKAPATLAEAEAIRAAAGLGPLGPSNSDNLIDGLRARYGWAPKKVAGFGAFDFDAFWAELTPGKCATAGGFITNLENLDPPSRLARFLPGFDRGHRVYVQRESDADEVFWMDPEGRPVDSYGGDIATKSELRTFMRNGSGATIDRIGRLKEASMVAIVDTTPMQVQTRPEAQYFELTGEKASRAVTNMTRTSPYGVRVEGIAKPARVLDVFRKSLQARFLLVVDPDDPNVSIGPMPVP